MEAVLPVMPKGGRILAGAFSKIILFQTAIIGPAGRRREAVGRVQIGLERGDDFLGACIGDIRPDHCIGTNGLAVSVHLFKHGKALLGQCVDEAHGDSRADRIRWRRRRAMHDWRGRRALSGCMFAAGGQRCGGDQHHHHCLHGGLHHLIPPSSAGAYSAAGRPPSIAAW